MADDLVRDNESLDRRDILRILLGYPIWLLLQMVR